MLGPCYIFGPESQGQEGHPRNGSYQRETDCVDLSKGVRLGHGFGIRGQGKGMREGNDQLLMCYHSHSDTQMHHGL